MSTPDPNSIGGSFFDAASEASAAEQLQRIARERQSIEGIDRDQLVPMPGGRMARLVDVIDHDYAAEDHTSIFNDVERYLKHPTPGAQYCWAAKDDPNTYGRERRKEYRRVEWDELREDISLPLTTHVGPTGEYCCVYDLVLMEMPPDIVRRKRHFPAQAALLRTVRGIPFKRMKEAFTDISGGAVRTEAEITSEDGRTTELH